MSPKVIKVKAIAGVKKESVEKIGEDSYKIRASVPPEKGKANERIRELLAKHLGVSKSKVSLKSGASSQMKIFVVALS